MKKYFSLFFFIFCTICVSAQMKVHSSYVGIGGDRITLKPANPGPEIGGSDGTRWSTISFWHTQTGWNKLLAKRYKTISDISFKTNISPIDNATSILSMINTYSYNFQENGYVSEKKEYGIIAQEVEKILPDIVDTINGKLCIDYDELIPFLIKGFNEQQKKIDSSLETIEFLLKEIEKLSRKIELLNKEIEKIRK